MEHPSGRGDSAAVCQAFLPTDRRPCGSAAHPRDGLRAPTGSRAGWGRAGLSRCRPDPTCCPAAPTAIFRQRPRARRRPPSPVPLPRRTGASASAAPLPAARQVPLLPRPRPSAPPPPPPAAVAPRAGEGRPRAAGAVAAAASRGLWGSVPGEGGREDVPLSPADPRGGGAAGYRVRRKGQGRGGRSEARRV